VPRIALEPIGPKSCSEEFIKLIIDVPLDNARHKSGTCLIATT